MKISALDLSLTATGWATGGNTQIVSFGTIAPRKLTGWERLNWIRSEVAEVVKGSDLVVCEGYAFARPNQAHQIGELHGVIRFWLWKHEFPVMLVAPAALKKFVTGRGNAEKDHMLREVWRRWSLEAANNNEADAIGLLYVGMAANGIWTPTTDAQRQVLKVAAA